MTCRQFVELVTAHLEDQLSPQDQAAFEEHIQQCPGCDRYLDQFRTTISLLGELRETSITPAARTRLLDAFAGWREHRGPDRAR